MRGGLDQGELIRVVAFPQVQPSTATETRRLCVRTGRSLLKPPSTTLRLPSLTKVFRATSVRPALLPASALAHPLRPTTGIGFSHRTVSLSRLPGWEDNSWGYHGDDGRAFCCLGTGETFGPTFTTGDVIGCGIDWTNAGPPGKDRERAKDGDKKGGGRAFFTKNGEFLGRSFAEFVEGEGKS